MCDFCRAPVFVVVWCGACLCVARCVGQDLKREAREEVQKQLDMDFKRIILDNKRMVRWRESLPSQSPSLFLCTPPLTAFSCCQPLHSWCRSCGCGYACVVVTSV